MVVSVEFLFCFILSDIWTTTLCQLLLCKINIKTILWALISHNMPYQEDIYNTINTWKCCKLIITSLETPCHNSFLSRDNVPYRCLETKCQVGLYFDGHTCLYMYIFLGQFSTSNALFLHNMCLSSSRAYIRSNIHLKIMQQVMLSEIGTKKHLSLPLSNLLRTERSIYCILCYYFPT